MDPIEYTEGYIEYTEGYKYQLKTGYASYTGIKPLVDIKTYYITLTKDGKLTIKKGYAWDGPSGPTYDTKTAMRGSLEHDAFYQLMRMGLLQKSTYRPKADKRFRAVCITDKMFWFRAWYFYKGVVIGGSGSADPSNKKPMLIAP